MERIRRILVAGCISYSLCLELALAQGICQPSGSGTALGFNISPSMVVNSDAVLDRKMSDIGGTGPTAGERVFSFRRTISSILKSAGFPDDPPAQERFVQTMLDTFAPANGFALNPSAGMLMPLDGRGGENTKLNAADLLDETSPIGLVPLALFNRFDLAPTDWSHCGEHRIVYGKQNPGFPSRFLLIFEAAVDNPGTGEAGCRPVAEFWAGLSEVATNNRALTERLSAFYYDGKATSYGNTVDLSGPVVDYRNYGGDGVRGQVRGNLFMQEPWQLREWLTQPIFDPATPLAFVTETVKDNPLAELYRDDFVSGPLAAQNFSAVLTTLQGEFVGELTSKMRTSLMAEDTPKYRGLVEELTKYVLGTTPETEVSEPTILKNTIALGNDKKFNEFQSTSQNNVPPGDTDEPRFHAQTKMRTLLSAMLAQPTPHLQPQDVDTFLNRATAGTCAGCHQTAPGQNIRTQTGLPPVVFPSQHPTGFVHVGEDRTLSDALTFDFLPFRRYVLGRYLCPITGPAAASAAAPGVQTTFAARPFSSTDAQQFSEGIVSAFLSEARSSQRLSAPQGAAANQQQSVLAQATSQLDDGDRAILRRRIRDAIDAARTAEQQIPGAFVEVRRPH